MLWDGRDEIAKSFARQKSESQTAAGEQAARAQRNVASGRNTRRRHSADTGRSQDIDPIQGSEDARERQTLHDVFGSMTDVDPNQGGTDALESQMQHDVFGSGTAERASQDETDADSTRIASSGFDSSARDG